jgi:Asp-tRNA(Asn)/Glu-tRNA(Gln) amidotransferase B subunit
VRYLDISDAIMAQGSMRCDVNVSIRPKGETELGTRTELKNINSFRFVEKAINSEIQRQQDLLEDGGKVVQETRRYDAERDTSSPMRSKEFRKRLSLFSRNPICCPWKLTMPISKQSGLPCLNSPMPERPASLANMV